MNKRSVFIVGGGGMVGATVAYAVALKEIVSNIVLIDVAKELVEGQAMDINDATAYTHGVRVRAGDYRDIQTDDIVIITSGASLKPGQTRLELLETNAGIIKDVVSSIMRQGKQVYIVMVANPVDVLTYVALKASGLPPERVLGTGTTIDSARLRVKLANSLNVSQKHIHAYTLGEHGDSSFPALSGATIGGIPLADFPGFQSDLLKTIDQDIRDAAYKMVQSKKSMYGIGHATANVVQALVRDTHSILPVCSLATGQYGIDDVVIGLPSLVSSGGVKILENYPLSEAELQQLRDSAAVIRKVIDQVK